MTKILLVEDDKSLREIYGVRLKAEGYDIVSAGDGEEALALAIKERPDLVISDVMMPKVSGFDMLDILRSTTETKNIKVIVMTALSSEEQRQRGEMLGADKYLVKSQVGIEDVVHAVHEVLGDAPSQRGEAMSTFESPQPTAAPLQTPDMAEPAAPNSFDPMPSALAGMPEAPLPVSTDQTSDSLAQPLQQPPETSPQVAPQPPVPAPQPAAPSADVLSRPGNRVITPLSDPTKPTFDINALLDLEIAKEAGVADSERPVVMTTAESQAVVQQKIDNAATDQLNAVPEVQPAANPAAQEPVVESVLAINQPEPAPNDTLDSVQPDANTPSVPLQARESAPVIMPPPRTENPGNALTGTTLPPTSAM